MKEEMTTTSKNDLDVLLQLYFCIQNKLEFRLKRSEEPPMLSITALAVLVGAQFFSDGLVGGNANVLVLAIIYLYPIVVNISMQKAAEEHTFIAILRGYSASLEKRINNLIDNEVFIYNLELYDKYIEKENIENGKGENSHMAAISTYAAGFCPIAICAVLIIYNVIKQKYSLGIIILLVLIALIAFPVYFKLITISSRGVANTKKIRKEVEFMCDNDIANENVEEQ